MRFQSTEHLPFGGSAPAPVVRFAAAVLTAIVALVVWVRVLDTGGPPVAELAPFLLLFVSIAVLPAPFFEGWKWLPIELASLLIGPLLLFWFAVLIYAIPIWLYLAARWIASLLS
jgi:hypothetical protein